MSHDRALNQRAPVGISSSDGGVRGDLRGQADLKRWLLDVLLAVGRDSPTGTSVYLSGPPGIGKSHLLNGALEALPESTRVLRLTGEEGLRNEPFAAVELLTGAAFPQTTGPDPVETAFEAVDAFCAVGPVIVAVDDVQHLDSASLVVLRRLVWSSRSLPLGVIIAGRSFPERDAVQQIARQVTTQCTVPGLSSLEAEALIRARTGRWPGQRLSRLIEIAGGNPLFAVTVLVSLENEGALATTGPDRIDVLAGVHPPMRELGALILAGLHDLDESTRELLAALAVWGGTGVTVDDLAATIYTSPELLADPLGRAVAAGLISPTTKRSGDDRVRFTHQLYREVVAAEIDDATGRALHRRVADLLRGRVGMGSAVLAEHLLRGAPPKAAAGPAVLKALRQAVERNADVAPSVAADLLAGADSLADLGVDVEPMLLERARQLFVAGRGRQAEQLVTERIGSVRDPAVAADLQVILLRSLANRGETTAAIAIIDQILDRPALPQAARHRAQAQREWLLLLTGEDRSTDSESLLARYEAGGDLAAIAGQLSTMAITQHFRGDTETAVHLLRRRGALVGDRMDIEVLSIAAIWPAVFDLALSTPESGLAAVAEARHASAVLDLRRIEPFLCSVAGSALLLAGDWDGAIAEFSTGFQLADEVGTGTLSAAVGYRAYIDAHRGATAAARSRLDDFRLNGRLLQFGQNQPGLAELAVLEAEGRTGPAVALARTLWNQAAAGFSRWMFELAPDVLRVAMTGLDRQLAESVHRRILAVPTPQGQQAIPLLIGGAFDADPEQLQAAVDILTERRRTTHAVFATEELAYAYAVAGDRMRASEMLNRAVVGYEQLGSLPDRDRALSRCRQLGVRAGNRGRARSGKRGWEALSESERRIAVLVGEGLTNPEIAGRLYISPRTVQTHVSHILTKTGLRSRVEIASELPG